MSHVKTLTCCALVILLAAGAGAAPEPGEGRGAPSPTPPAPRPPAKRAPPAQPAEAPVARHRRLLRETVVHFEFQRAPVEDIFAALEKASEVRVRLGKAARRALEKRRFKIKYVADRTGEQVLSDVCKASALDFVVVPEGVYVDTPRAIRKLRKKLGLTGKALRLSGADVAKLLETKELSLVSRERPLSEFLRFLRAETGIRFVRLSPAKAGQPEPKVTVKTTATPLHEVLDLAFAPLQLDWIRSGSVVLVGSAAEIAEQRKPLPRQGEEPKDPPRGGPRDAPREEAPRPGE